jgi:RNA recognition motif-containing protein
MNLYIGNLDYKVQENQLRDMFESHGEVESVKIITDKMTGRSKGFAFVEMPNDAEANNAIEDLNGRTLGQREITVNQARPKEEGGGGGSRNFSRGGGNSGGYNKRY